MAGISWMSYVVWKVRQDPTRWKGWGFHTDNLRQAFMWPSVVFAGSGLAMAWYGIVAGQGLWQGHMLLLLFLYPLWGVLQQFLVQALGVDNLMKIFPQHGLWLAMPIGVILFALVHFPDWWLMLATGLMACFFIPFYIRDRNLWPLGLYHGWLGTFFYLWVLGRDPWVTVFGR